MKGQYALPIVLLVMFLVVILYSNYSTQTSTSVYRTYSHKPNLAGDLIRYEKALKLAFVESIYSGGTGQVDQVINELKYDAMKNGNYLTISCADGKNNAQSTFWISCTMNLSSGSDIAISRFNYTYTVPFAIRTFLDSDLSYETDYFVSGDTVYYRVTGHNGDDINITIYDPYNRVFEKKSVSIGNWHYDSSFTPTISGNWTIYVENTTMSGGMGGEPSGETVSKVVHVEIVSMEIDTYDEDGNPQNEFAPGDLVNITVALKDMYDQVINCSIKVAIANALGKLAYQLQGQAENGVFSGTITLSPWEESGNMTITATEHCFYSQAEKNITVTPSTVGRFIKVLPPRMIYNKPHQSVFGSSCGYTEWYSSNETYYGIVPFYVKNETNDTLLVNQTTVTIDVPNANISWIHFIGSRG